MQRALTRLRAFFQSEPYDNNLFSNQWVLSTKVRHDAQVLVYYTCNLRQVELTST